ncbi:hypothetical protein [Colwellia sp. 20A7]|uniref:hypothetical protein n=1 Tax=Colwellia sp. 20A7 TaxID=2689569 RepID=UPI001916B105|nr:hypothetical protein [Colwellia sp. 20A7]
MDSVSAVSGVRLIFVTKRLSKGKFQNWPSSNKSIEQIIAKKLRKLLCDNDPLWEKMDPLY